MSSLKAVYVMGFTPEKMENDAFVQMCRMAGDFLEKKDAAFRARMDQINTQKVMLHFSNQVFIPLMHNPHTMQTTLGGWMKNEGIPFAPVLGENFFVNGIRDPQGREHYVLFYFHSA